MRFLIASAISNSVETGMGKWSHSVANALRAEGHAVTLWFRDEVIGARSSTFSSVVMYPVRLAVAVMRARQTFDVVVVHEPSGFWYALARRVNRSMPPIIAMCHNVESKWYRQWGRATDSGFARMPWWTRLKSPIFRMWQSNGTIRWADHVVCLSSEDQEYLTRVLHRDPRDVTRTANGVAKEEFANSQERRPFTILFVGGWLDVKGARLLPLIFRSVRRRVPESRLTLAGVGVPAEAVVSDFDPVDRSHLCVLKGPVDAATLRNLYGTHNVFLMPSLSEGSPLSLLEAMACGCVVIAAAVGGIPDIIRSGTDGLLFEKLAVDDAAVQLEKVFSDAGLATTLRQSAVARAHAFNWTNTARALESAARLANQQRPAR